MLSNHYPFLFTSDHGWLTLVAVGALLAWLRHFFNLKHQGVFSPVHLVLPCGGLLLVAAATLYSAHGEVAERAPATDGGVVTSERASAIIQQHCAGCHADEPAVAAFSSAPAGLVLDSPEALRQHSRRSLEAVKSGYMPLGNRTEMSDAERDALVRWLQVE
mgnify:CR=1 FL=1